MCSCYLIFLVLTIIFSEPVMSSWGKCMRKKKRKEEIFVMCREWEGEREKVLVPNFICYELIRPTITVNIVIHVSWASIDLEK